MEFETFDQLFKYRPNCLCGRPLAMTFAYSSSLDDDYSYILPEGYYKSEDGAEMIFNFALDGKKPPTGKSSFIITAKVSSPHFSMVSTYTDSSKKDRRITSTEFVKSHFNLTIQESLNISMCFKCDGVVGEKQCFYLLQTSPIQFKYSTGFNAANGEIVPISIREEKFSLKQGKNRYYFNTSYLTNKTIITYNTPKSGFVIGWQEKIEVPAEKFSKFPLDQELLLNKLKTLLLFS